VDIGRLEGTLVRPDLIEAYARRMVASLAKELGSRAVSTQRTLLEHPDAQVVEWKALLANGCEIRLSAAVLAQGGPDGMPTESSQADLEELRNLGISPGDAGCD
jgi:hypothetical protein